MPYIKHNFQDGQVLTGAAMDDIDQAVFDLDADNTVTKAQVQKLRIIETGSITLTNTLEFPFNNSKRTVALKTAQANTYYQVDTAINNANGMTGDIVVSERMTNGFAIEFTGSAASVTVDYFVIGGYSE